MGASTAQAQTLSPPASAVAPESASGYSPKPGWVYARQAVAAAHPLAAQAGLAVLREGGSAVDAAVAVQMVLALVEPQSSGIGGGAFLLHADGPRVQAYDGRETAPVAAGEGLFLDASGQPLPFMDAVSSGRSVGVPGVVRMLETAHRSHGRLPWARLFEPAIALAENGFPISPRLHALLLSDPALRRDPLAARLYYDAKGQPWPVGHRLRNPGLAAVLKAIAAQGSIALHEGPLAQAIVEAVRTHPVAPGWMTMADLATYRPRVREAICVAHQATASRAAAIAPHPAPAPAPAPGSTPMPAQPRAVRLCGFPPPSSGAIAIGQILGLLAHTPAWREPLGLGPGGVAGTRTPAPSANWLHLYTEAARLAFADRALYLADPDAVEAPAGDWLSLLDPGYLRERARLLGETSLRQAPAGSPPPVPSPVPLQTSPGNDTPPRGARSPARSWPYAAMPVQAESGTSHISIVDAHGHALAMTSTIESAFGARLMVSPDPALAGGFLLNNQLTDFSFTPRDAQGRPIANRVQGGKRPRSSMSPTLVFDADSGEWLASLGSPGGAAIIHYTAKALIGLLHWGLDPQAAADLPNVSTLNGPTLLEQGRFDEATRQALAARGAEVFEGELTSGLQILMRSARGIEGGADPRREGVVLGD